MSLRACLLFVVTLSAPLRLFAADYALVGVALLPMDRDGVLPDQTVLVSGDRITAVGRREATPVPEGARIIDGSGRYLIPGLAEMHGHLPGAGATADMVERVLWLNLANGITTVRGMQGHASQLQLRDAIAAGHRTGPQLIVSSPALHGRRLSDPRRAAELVRDYADAGYDLLKVHEELSPAVFDAIAGAAQASAIPFAGHITDQITLAHAVAGGISTVEHMDGLVEAAQPEGAPPVAATGFFGSAVAGRVTPESAGPVAQMLAESEVWVTPTQTLLLNVAGGRPAAELEADPEVGARYWPEGGLAGWRERLARYRDAVGESDGQQLLTARAVLLAALREAGVGLLLGADAPQVYNVPGFATLNEAEALAAAGYTPLEVLRAGTVNPARYLQREGDFGVIAAGARADLVLLEGNPLEDIRRLRLRAGVMAAGVWFPAQQLQDRLEQLAQ